MIPFVGVSYGRSGTQSLAKILRADHESVRFPWYPTVKSMRDVAVFMRQKRGQIGFTNLSHLQFMRKTFPDLPVITIRRERGPCVESHLKICGGDDRLSALRLRDQATNAYPTLPDVNFPEAGWGCWWDICTFMMDQIALPKYDLWMHELNCDEAMEGLCDWLESQGVPFDEDFHIPAKRRWDVNAKYRVTGL